MLSIPFFNTIYLINNSCFLSSQITTVFRRFITNKFITLYVICDLYCEEIRNRNSDQKAGRIINEFRSALFRFLLAELGFKRITSGRKMTAIDVQAAEDYTKTITVLRLLKSRELIEKAFERADIPQSSRNTYGSRLDQFLRWSEQQSWCPCERLLRIQDQCRPPQRISGRRHYSDLPLTSRNGQYLRYRLLEAATPPALQSQLDDFDRFLTAPRFPGRVFNSVKRSTGGGYLRELRLILGFFHQHKQESIPLDQLKFEDLVPLVAEDDLDGLSYRQQQLWKEKQLYLESWLCE